VQNELEELVTYYRTVAMKPANYTSKPKRNSNEDKAHVETFDANNLQETSEQNGLLPQNGKQSTKGHLTPEQTAENTEVTIQRKNSVLAVEKCPLSEVTVEVCGKGKHDSRWFKFVANVKLLLEPETLRPLILAFLIFLFSGMGGMMSVKPFMVEVLQRFQSPLDPKWSSVSTAYT
jgi:hypothetical protein